MFETLLDFVVTVLDVILTKCVSYCSSNRWTELLNDEEDVGRIPSEDG